MLYPRLIFPFTLSFSVSSTKPLLQPTNLIRVKLQIIVKFRQSLSKLISKHITAALKHTSKAEIGFCILPINTIIELYNQMLIFRVPCHTMCTISYLDIINHFCELFNCIMGILRYFNQSHYFMLCSLLG